MSIGSEESSNASNYTSGRQQSEDSNNDDGLEKLLGSRRLAKGTAAVFMSQFAQAASRGDVIEVKRMLEARTDVNEATLRGTALHEACRRGHFEIAQLLCDAGASIDSCDITGDTPLHCSVSHGHVSIATLLISLRADVRAREVAGATPLQCATTSVFIRSDDARRTLIELLLAAGADPDARDLVGISPSHSGHVQVLPRLPELAFSSASVLWSLRSSCIEFTPFSAQRISLHKRTYLRVHTHTRTHTHTHTFPHAPPL